MATRLPSSSEDDFPERKNYKQQWLPFFQAWPNTKQDKSGFLYSVTGSTLSPIIMVLSGKWLHLFEKNNDPIGDTPPFWLNLELWQEG